MEVENGEQDVYPKLKQTNWLCTHGIYDDVLSFETSKSQVEILQNGGFDIMFKSYPKDHTIVEDELRMIQRWIEDKTILK